MKILRIFLFSTCVFTCSSYASDASEPENQAPPASSEGREVRSWRSNAKTSEQSKALYKFQSMQSKEVAKQAATVENADAVQQRIHIESQVADYKQREKERLQAQSSSSSENPPPRLKAKKKVLTDAEKDLIRQQFPGHMDRVAD